MDSHSVSYLSCLYVTSLQRPCLPRTDVLGGGVAADVGVEGVAAGGWVRMLAAVGG